MAVRGNIGKFSHSFLSRIMVLSIILGDNKNILSSPWVPFFASFKSNRKPNLLNPPKSPHFLHGISLLFITFLTPHLAQQILNIHLPLSPTPDRWI
jgi:hypothetical protein